MAATKMGTVESFLGEGTNGDHDDKDPDDEPKGDAKKREAKGNEAETVDFGDDTVTIRKSKDGKCLTGEAVQLAPSDRRLTVGKVMLNLYLSSLFYIWHDLCGKWIWPLLLYVGVLLVPVPVDGWSYATRMQVRAAVIMHATIASLPALLVWIVKRGGRLGMTALGLYIASFTALDHAHERGGRFFAALRKRSFWRHWASYFPMRLTRTHELDPKQKYIFGYHPHGVISLGAMCNFATDATGFSKMFPGIDLRLLTLEMNFKLPFSREFLLGLGVNSASKTSCIKNLKRGAGAAIMLVVGGARESLHAGPGQASLVLANRKGFVKIAIQAGACLVPVYSFGENDVFGVYEATGWFRKWQLKMQKKLGFAMPLFYGRALTGGLLHRLFKLNVGVMPLRVPVHSVVGKPIPTTQCDNPSQEEIDRVHNLYKEELLRIYNDWNETCTGDLKKALQGGDQRRLEVLKDPLFNLAYETAESLDWLQE